MSIFNVISMAGGLALFLYGMRLMGDGLKQSSSGALKKALEKVTNSPVMGFLLGLLVTCIIQSSNATIILTSGLVAAGVLSLHQSLGIILGANVGTTVTGQIIRLLDLNASATSWLNFFKPSTLAPLVAIIGILLIMVFRFRNSDLLGSVAMGFAILFTGLMNMTAAVSPLSESPLFSQLFLELADKPVLGFLGGAVATFAIQSASATVGILQALAQATGKLTFASIYSVLIGIYLGSCAATAAICSIGAKADAKRTGMIHILFNICTAVMVAIGVTVAHKMGLLDSFWNKPIASGGIANANTLFKLVCTLLLLPFCGLFEKLSRKIIKDDPVETAPEELQMEGLDDVFFSSPVLALSRAQDVANTMLQIASTNVRSAMDCINHYNPETVEQISTTESTLDTMTDQVSSYLLRLSSHVPQSDRNSTLSYYIKCVTDFERIGDMADNLTENAGELFNKNETFSRQGQAELALLRELLERILTHTQQAFLNQDAAAARQIEPLEEVMDDLVAALRANHFSRLQEGRCNVYAGVTFLDILVNVERISDLCSNVGIHTLTLVDPQVGEMQHDYARRLHQGEDPAFNRAYSEARKDVFDRLAVIHAAEG